MSCPVWGLPLPQVILNQPKNISENQDKNGQLDSRYHWTRELILKRSHNVLPSLIDLLTTAPALNYSQGIRRILGYLLQGRAFLDDLSCGTEAGDTLVLQARESVDLYLQKTFPKLY